MIKNFNILFVLTLILGTIDSISSNSFFAAWVGLEINLLSFIPLISNNYNTMENESILKYFLVQALGSSVFLFSCLIQYFFYINFISFNFLINLLIVISLFLKIAVAPFHNWIINIIEGITWINRLIVLTWQKLAPLVLFSYCNLPLVYSSPFIILSSLIGAVGALNQVSLRKILSFSSINHLGWILSSVYVSKSVLSLYFLFYLIINLTIIVFLIKIIISFINQIYIIKSLISLNFLFLSLFRLGGLPPFSGFIIKWILIDFINLNNFNFISIILIISSLITLFFYIQILYSSILIIKFDKKINLFLINNYKIIFISVFIATNLSLPIIIIIFSSS